MIFILSSWSQVLSLSTKQAYEDPLFAVQHKLVWTASGDSSQKWGLVTDAALSEVSEEHHKAAVLCTNIWMSFDSIKRSSNTHHYSSVKNRASSWSSTIQENNKASSCCFYGTMIADVIKGVNDVLKLMWTQTFACCAHINKPQSKQMTQYIKFEDIFTVVYSNKSMGEMIFLMTTME